MQDPIYQKVEGQPRPSFGQANVCLLLAAVGLWVSGIASILLGDAATEAATNALYYIPFVIVPVAVCMARRPGCSDAMRLKPLPVMPTLSVCLMAVDTVLVASALTALWQFLLERLGLGALPDVAAPQTSRELTMAVLMSAAVPAVCEELLFRGLIMSAWERRGTGYAIGVTATLFALLHGNLQGLPAYLLVGALTGWLVAALDSLYAGMVFHTVYNTACLVIPYMMRGLEEEAEAAMTSAQMASVVVETLEAALLLAAMIFFLHRRRKMMQIDFIPRIRRAMTGKEKAALIAALLVMLSLIAVTTVSTWTGMAA